DTPDSMAYFTSYGWFDATAQVHPDAPWVLWDATRNEFLSADCWLVNIEMLAARSWLA
ncbi:MAG: hypothetical protein QOH31_462, partial [Verrucomicrobiota bacterium]